MARDDYAFGEAGAAVEEQVRDQLQKEVRLFERAVDLAKAAIGSAAIAEADRQRVIATGLLGRLLRLSEAGVLLTLRGLEHDAAILIRAAVELYVKLRHCALDPDFHRRYVDADLYRRRKLANGSLSLPDLPKVRKTSLEEAKRELQAEIDGRGAKELPGIEQLCTDAGCARDYQSVFRITSAAVHTAPRVLNDLVEMKDGRLVGFDFGPRAAKANSYILTLAEYLLRATRDFQNLMGSKEPSEEFQQMWIEQQEACAGLAQAGEAEEEV